uniref:Histidinol-phosphate aminotransferase n=1 Tax=Thermodesulfobacterium geofontis TaxID=1295609 RepID=A0A7V4N3P6_9BACT
MSIKVHLKSLKPYPSGKTVEELKKELCISGKIYKMNSNENPLGPSPKVLDVLKGSLSQINYYPEASYRKLKEALAEKWDVLPEQIILGNGSNEIIDFLFKALIEFNEEIIISKPCFLMYEKFAQIYGVKIKTIALTEKLTHNFDEIFKSITEKTKIIFLDHPHNPSGSVLNRESWKNFLEKIPSHVLIVIDEAYGDFIEDSSVPLGIEFLKDGYKVLILRTFSKAFGLAGLRLGYGITFLELSKVLDLVRQPFNINVLAYKAGLAALEDKEYIEKSINLVKEGRKYLTEKLTNLGFKVYPSQANFIMVDFGEKADFLYEQFLKRGFLLRPLKAYGFPNALRISIGLPEENEAFIKNLKDLLNLLP